MPSASFDTAPIPLGRSATSVAVARYDGETYEFLPHIVPVQVEESEGPEPGAAQFRYVFRDTVGAAEGTPSRFDEVYPITATGLNAVKNDDRIAVIEYDDEGIPTLIFHGFAQIPQLDLGPTVQQVTFQALGTAVRCWDAKLGGAVLRSAAAPDDPETDVPTDLPCRFNPDGKPNATPVDADSGNDGELHPVFMDHLVVRTPEVRRHWTIAMAAKYIIAKGNPAKSGGVPIKRWIEPPDFGMLDALLDSRKPKSDDEAMDPSDPDTYESSPIICQDLDVKGKAWPEALALLLEPHGFGMTFRTESGEGETEEAPGEPYQYLEVYRKDDAGEGTAKTLTLQPPGSTLDPGKSNLSACSLSRSVTDLANKITVDTSPVEYEITVVLAPGFTIAAGDVANLADYVLDSANYPANTGKYRDYVANEAGDGRWDYGTSATVMPPPDLSSIFGSPDFGVPAFSVRRRPGKSELFSVPAGGTQPRRAQLWISTDYAGPIPGVWDGTGTWQLCQSGWSLLTDRLGIRLTAKNVETDWNIGTSKITGVPFPSGKVRGVTCQAVPNAGQSVPRFFLRLTCVVEGDKGLGIVSPKRPWSPTKFTVEHVDEQRDRFKKLVIAKKSQYNTTDKAVLSRDDTAKASSHADARRLSHELGPISGSVSIPRLTSAYRVGDRITAIAGRDPDISLGMGAGNQAESQVYPSVVKVSRTYSPQGVTLHLSDRRAEPTRRRQS